MISAAQKKARENFKKAIEYKKKTGCSLKQAFAHVSGKKTVAKKVVTVKKNVVKKTAKKKIGAAPKIEYFFNAFKYKTNPKTGMFEVSEKKHFKIVGTNLRTAKDNAHKKYPYPWTIELENSSLKKSKEIGVIKNKVLRSPLKKKASKKPSEQSILNKIHKVKHDVERLDEAQHKHMSGMGAFNKHVFVKLESVSKEIDQREIVIKSVISRKKSLIKRNGLAWFKNWLKMAKSYVSELKKHKTELKKHI